VNDFKKKFSDILEKEEKEEKEIELDEVFLQSVDISTSDAFVPSASELIEEAITTQVKKDFEKKISNKKGKFDVDVSNIPTYESITSKYQTCLLSLT
jgi:hypothetical protein